MLEMLIGLFMSVLLIWFVWKSRDEKFTLHFGLAISVIGAVSLSVVAIVTKEYLTFIFVGVFALMGIIIGVVSGFGFRDLKKSEWVKKHQAYTEKVDNNKEKTDVCDLKREIIDYCAFLIDRHEGDGESPSCKDILLLSIQQKLDTDRGIFEEIPIKKYGIILIMESSLELIESGSFHYLKGELDKDKSGVKMLTLCMNLAAYSVSCHLLEGWEAQDYVSKLKYAIKTAW